MKKTFWIYLITNLITGKRYIGQTNDISKRKSAHKLGTDGKMTFIKSSISKYGWSNHKFEVLFYATDVDLRLADQIEKYYIRYYNTQFHFNKEGMNLTEGGMTAIPTRDQISVMIESKFQATKRKLGKGGSAIQVYDKSGNFLFNHFESARKLLEKLNLITEENSKIRITQVLNHLKTGGLLFHKKYIVQWEGEDRVGQYAASLERMRARVVVMNKTCKKTCAAAVEKTRIPVLNMASGVVYKSVTELTRELGIDRSLFRYRYKNWDDYKLTYKKANGDSLY